MHLYIKSPQKGKILPISIFQISVVMQKWLWCFLHHCIGAYNVKNGYSCKY